MSARDYKDATDLIVILNDQGGAIMSVEKDDLSPTLRAQDHGHPPVVAYRQSSFANYEEGVGTLRASGGDAGGLKPCYCVDCRNMAIDPWICNTLQSHMSNNLNSGGVIMEEKAISYGFKPRQGAKASSLGFEEEISTTLAADTGACGGGVLIARSKSLYTTNPMRQSWGG